MPDCLTYACLQLFWRACLHSPYPKCLCQCHIIRRNQISSDVTPLVAPPLRKLHRAIGCVIEDHDHHVKLLLHRRTAPLPAYPALPPSLLTQAATRSQSRTTLMGEYMCAAYILENIRRSHSPA